MRQPLPPAPAIEINKNSRDAARAWATEVLPPFDVHVVESLRLRVVETERLGSELDSAVVRAEAAFEAAKEAQYRQTCERNFWVDTLYYYVRRP